MKPEMEKNYTNDYSKGIFPLAALENAPNTDDIQEKTSNFSIKNLVKKDNPLNYDGYISAEYESLPTQPRLSQKQMNEFRDTFSLFDKEEEGKIMGKDLQKIMLNLKQNIKYSELMEILQDTDEEYFSFEQFIKILGDLNFGEMDEETELKNAFRVFDKRNLGYIYASDLRVAWLSFDINLTEREIEEMINEVDIDGDGRINFDEFVKALKIAEESDNDDKVGSEDSK